MADPEDPPRRDSSSGPADISHSPDPASAGTEDCPCSLTAAVRYAGMSLIKMDHGLVKISRDQDTDQFVQAHTQLSTNQTNLQDGEVDNKKHLDPKIFIAGALLCPADALPPPLLGRTRVLVLAATAIPTKGDVM